MARIPAPSVPPDFPNRGWFAHSHPDFRRDIFALARPQSFAAGHLIYRAGDPGRNVFGVSSGVVAVQSRFTHPDAVLLHMLRPGDWFGTVPVLAEQTRRINVIARTDVELLRVSGDELRGLLRLHPGWTAELTRDIVFSLDVAMQGAADLLIRNASARCAAVLLRLAGRRWVSDSDADQPSGIPASQTELAMLCNVSRNTFSRVVKGFTSRRIVTLGYKSLTVNDPVRLREVADGG